MARKSRNKRRHTIEGDDADLHNALAIDRACAQLRNLAIDQIPAGSGHGWVSCKIRYSKHRITYSDLDTHEAIQADKN